MKLTTEQETLLVVLVAVEDYKTDKDYGKDGLLDKIGDLGMEENGFYMEEMLDDFEALKSNGLIEFECEEWSKEEIEDHVESPVTYIEVLDKGKDYVRHMSDPAIVKIWESVKGYLGNINLNIDSFIKFEFNFVKI